jgi:ABC-2 type transport system ATP-binding protein
MITTDNLVKNFGKFKALDNISLNVDDNLVYGFLGHNGAGKSTTIEILAGLSKPSLGSVKIGTDIIGYLPEEPKFYPWMTGLEYLTFIGSDYKGDRKKRVKEMLNWVGLEKAAKRKIGGYSRGMRQRLGMAVALIYDPQLILLDEPSSALDPEGRADVLNMIKELKDRGKTVFLSTHILDDVEKVCDKVGIIREGKMIKEGNLEEIMNHYTEPNFELTFTKEPDPYEIIQISKESWVKDITTEGRKISIVTRDDMDFTNGVYGIATKLKTPVESVLRKKHTLEEIYMMITDGEE